MNEGLKADEKKFVAIPKRHAQEYQIGNEKGLTERGHNIDKDIYVRRGVRHLRSLLAEISAALTAKLQRRFCAFIFVHRVRPQTDSPTHAP